MNEMHSRPYMSPPFPEPSGFNSTVPAQPQPPAIVVATDRLNAITSSIIDVVSQLESKCSALLGPESPVGEGRAGKFEGPPLAGCIHEACDGLSSADDRLRRLRDRIEL